MSVFEHDILPNIFDDVRAIDAQIASAVALGLPMGIITALRAFRAQTASSIPGSATPHNLDDYVVARDVVTSNVYELPIRGLAPSANNLPSLGFPIGDITVGHSMDSYPLMAFDTVNSKIWIPVYYDLATYLVDSLSGAVTATLPMGGALHPSSAVWSARWNVVLIGCNSTVVKVDPTTHVITDLAPANAQVSAGNGLAVSDAGWVYFCHASSANFGRINLNGAFETLSNNFTVGDNTAHHIIALGASVFVLTETRLYRFDEAGATPWPAVSASLLLTLPSSQPYGFAYSPISGHLYSARSDGHIDEIDPATLSVVATLNTPAPAINTLLVNVNNGSLYAFGSDNRIYVINVLTGKVINTIQTNLTFLSGAVGVFDDTHNRLAVAFNADSKLKQWAP